MERIFRRHERWGSGVQVAITSGTIKRILTEYRIDALVSSDDTDLSMGGGVSREIAELAGLRMVEEARQVPELSVGSIAVTSGGGLDVRCIMHAATVDWVHRLFASDKTVRQITQDVFARCEAERIEGLALPALGTGISGFPPMSAAGVMLGALSLHLKSPSSLRRVVFCLPDPLVFKAFKDVAIALSLAGFSRRVLETTSAETARPKDDGVSAPQTRLTRKTKSSSESIELSSGTPQQATKSPLQDPDSRPVFDRRYVVLRELGRGGLGVVYQVWDLVLQRIRAIKVLRDDLAESPATLDLLKRDAAPALRLAHEGIVRIYQFEPQAENVGPYFAMEYVTWVSAERWAADSGSSGLPVRAVVGAGVQVCEALGYAHRRGIVHGGIKPSNLFVDTANGNAKLGDFGLGRLFGGETGRAIQAATSGTPPYMAPEQRESDGKVSQATDIYLLAATLWDLLTGLPPTPQNLVADYGRDAEPLLHLLKQAMGTKPESRPGDVREFSEKLDEALLAGEALYRPSLQWT